MRKRIIKVLSVTMVLFILAAAAGCAGGGNSGSEEKTQVIDSGNGLRITIAADMTEDPTEGFELFYVSDYAMMSVIREDYELLRQSGIDPDGLTIEGYRDLVSQANGITFSTDSAGQYYSDYTRKVDANNFYYYATVAQSSDAFWVITFACFESDKAKYGPKFAEWCSTVETY